MFCPRCKAEYREGFRTCSDCNVDLVTVLPAESIRVNDEKGDEVPKELRKQTTLFKKWGRTIVSVVTGAVTLTILMTLFDKSLFIVGPFAVIFALLIYFMWSPPRKHKTFSNSDRLKAMSRALGGSGPPELWTPDMPVRKSQKRKRG